MQIVAPQETQASRMRPLAVLPAFFDLNGRKVILAGGGEGLVWKAELLAATGAEVEVYCGPETGADLARLAAAPPAGTLRLMGRTWSQEDLSGAAIAVGALEGAEAEAFAAAARQHGVPVNIVDAPQLSTFSFGTIVNRSPVVVAISTAGLAPVLGQAIRARIEALLHPALAEWAAAARRLRAEVKARLPMGHARRALWRRFADLALAARTAPADADIDTVLADMPSEAGSVTLVGAGPGDPELLTLKALRALQSADVILHDRLVAPEILELARREARRMLVGKAGGGAHCRQDDINALMVRLARSGKRVVRLKGGDPMVFGRAAEEIAICRANGIAVDVVPGVTAALGAAAELLLPLTDRTKAQRLQFVTGHAKSGHAPKHDWASLARDDVTTVFYMGAATFAEMLPHMRAAGLAADFPALAIAGATTPRRRVVQTTVAELPSQLARMPAGEPCLIVVGHCAASMPAAQSVEDAAERLAVLA
ncbi:MAG: uroporphyrinogen-III C-methyltransferase [Hyphomicrobiales bacterium]|nr:MAG: uroporphyrinogen-III C-methyltransferase [Hyphomicrobiales bacterium]